jgi:3-methylcrotonyl-CoA carboxylase alpha subunit
MSRLLQKLLIANRGEIAVRIMRTAHRLGMHTIAIYSTADRDAPHVRLASESHLIGDPAPALSYLNVERLLEIAATCGADAIHPGYGFLAENADFASRCADQGLVFVGPPAEAIAQMGGKGQARALMSAAGVPTLPGIDVLSGITDDTREELRRIGYPLLLKPEAGGGGKGMKIVHDEGELAGHFDAGQREAASAFGNSAMMVEKYLLAPRHIEIQVFADQVGNCIHLGERDCSLQRRHQKIIEESPAPHLTPALREAMGLAAVTAARAIGYVNAGTVEFLLDADGGFYFMEMNTRLQVEHPVTEFVTGLDLVEWQLRVAAGEPLPDAPAAVDGHAVEARIYAEDTYNDFLPAAGRINYLRLPAASTRLRVDSGVQEGEQVGVYYDPMLMKIIAHGDTRDAALAQLAQGLAGLHLAGVHSNRDFLIAMLATPAFAAGGIATNYLDRLAADEPESTLLAGAPATVQASALIAVALMLLETNSADPWDVLPGFRLNQPDKVQQTLHIGVAERSVVLTPARYGWTARIDDGRYEIADITFSDDHLTFTLDQVAQSPACVRVDDVFTMFFPDATIEVTLPNHFGSDAEVDEGSLMAPMAGRITSIMVAIGDDVKKGQPLVAIEAMKMEHTLTAPHGGTVESIAFTESDLVDEGIEILTLAAPAESET